VESANVCGEFIFRAGVGGFGHSEDPIDGFDAGLEEFFGYTVQIIL